MEPKCVVFMCTMLFALLLLITGTRPQNFDDLETVNGNNHKGCAYLQCAGNAVCVHRKFRCKDAPCPGMLFCARTRAESLKGPSTCDAVKCTNGYVCLLKVRRCHWDEKCEQKIARCVSRREYHDGPASCAGYKCPQGNHCILRESFCAKPPCKLIRSCGKNKDVRFWFGKCRSLGCSSEYECFLRRPERNCTKPPCRHTPDCVNRRGENQGEFKDEVTNEHCRGWMCPRMQRCVAEIVGTCDANECHIKRSCHKVHVKEANDSSSFSRRSLKNKDETPGADTKVSKKSQQGNELKGTEMPQTLLHQLKSKSELDAMELWMKKAEEQKDFKQFQDWLRSIKDKLGSGAYSSRLEELLSSELRKRLRASHSKPEAAEPPFPGRERSRTLSKNPFPFYRDAGNVHPTEDLSEKMEEIGSLLKEKNVTNILEKIFVPSRTILPPYIVLETDLPNTLSESNLSLILNYLLKYPSYTGNQFFPLQSPEIEDDQQFLVVPVKNMKELANSQIINYDPDVQDHREIITENEKISGKQNNLSLNVPEEERNLSSTKEELSSLWSGLQEDFEKKLPKKEAHSVEDSIGLSGDKRLMGREQHFDDIPVDLLENFLKSMQLAPIENAPQTFDEKPIEGYREDNASEAPRSKEHNQKFGWSLMDHNQDIEGITRSINFEDGINQFPSLDNDNGNFSNNLESGASMLPDRSDNTRTLDHADRPMDTNSELPLHQPEDANDDEIDLNLFFEMNRESILPYIQTLMEAMNEENNNPLSQDTDPNSDESSEKSPLLIEGVTLGINEEFPTESKSTNIEPSNTFVVEALNDEKNFHDSQISKNELQEILSNLESQEGRESRTPEVIHANEEPTVPSFYNLPSYGASNGDIVLQDYIYDEYNRTKREDDDVKSMENNHG